MALSRSAPIWRLEILALSRQVFDFIFVQWRLYIKRRVSVVSAINHWVIPIQQYISTLPLSAMSTPEQPEVFYFYRRAWPQAPMSIPPQQSIPQQESIPRQRPFPPHPPSPPPPQSPDISADAADESPILVNAKQYARIVKRRVARERLEERFRLSSERRKGYMHESRHRHAMRRPRGPNGRFLTADEIAEIKRKTGSGCGLDVGNQSQGSSSVAKEKRKAEESVRDASSKKARREVEEKDNGEGRNATGIDALPQEYVGVDANGGTGRDGQTVASRRLDWDLVSNGWLD